MSKPIIKAEINENTPTIGVNVPDGNVPVLPVETIGGDSPIDLRTLTISSNNTHFEYNVLDDSYAWNKVVGDVHPITGPLNVTTNGVYDASESPYSFYGFDKVTVNVDTTKPDEVELVDFDFKNFSLLDKIRNYSVPNQNVQNLQTTADGIKFGATNSSCNIAFIPNTNSFYEIKIKFGTNSEIEFAQYNAILKLNRTDNHFTVTYCRDVTISDNPQGTWRISDSGGGAIYLTVGYGEPHYFDGKELKIEYGYYYDNGVFTLNLNKYSLSINGTYIHISNDSFFISGSSANANPVILLGGGSATMKGTVIESVKIKQLFKWNLTREINNDEEVR